MHVQRVVLTLIPMKLLSVAFFRTATICIGRDDYSDPSGEKQEVTTKKKYGHCKNNNTLTIFKLGYEWKE